MTVPHTAPLDYRNDAASDTVSWSNSKIHKQIGLLLPLSLWLAIWMPGTLRVTHLGLHHQLTPLTALILIPICWLAAGFVAAIFLRLFMHETIRVRDDMLILTLTGLGLHHTREIRREHIQRLSLETVDQNSVDTLNLFISRGALGRRIILAYTVHLNEKIALYNWLKSAMQRRDYRCEFHQQH